MLSKYQAKVYEEKIYLCEEIQCPKCSAWFMADYTHCALELRKNDNGDARMCFKMYCPYCGKEHYVTT